MPEDVLALPYQLINAGDYDGAYELFARRSKQVISLEQYRTFFEANAPYSVTDYSFPSVDVRGDAATVLAAFTVNSPAGQEFLERTQELVCEGAAWRVVMREEQAAAFAEAVSESQYEEPDPEPQDEAEERSELSPKGDLNAASESKYAQPEPDESFTPIPRPTPDPPLVPDSSLGGEDLDCKDFGSQLEAQAYYEGNLSDPSGLDANRDGEACEEYDY